MTRSGLVGRNSRAARIAALLSTALGSLGRVAHRNTESAVYIGCLSNDQIDREVTYP